MTAIDVVILLAVAIALLYVINRRTPLEEKTRFAVNVLVVVIVVLWLLDVLGIGRH